MLAAYYNGRAGVRVGNLPEPKILFPGEAIVRVTLAGMCSADLEFTLNVAVTAFALPIRADRHR
ncbi:threonine dehydrogenase-like Zn-dependent dehydrogenase [Paraburkholderia bannensis]|uniref:Threonine dehydrogenase-like Zn-dependent dehydrogenase n=1 Tax=Paraburkholderia bannensis TaxID=765414 RepID=A0A7W9U536_9BURK|nr:MULTISPECIES: hypothetical protein [Paraburkholderia]MBB3262205.1 threonine dehydrogenase-like Zn-dependent dehydrogenase [Paraburkholderia sp. WP4_3_2]MBB6107164.1 threonine dehydrogenase-like Zn-dependent dehydrogenase [Paraburkholderia bannensis]